MITKGKAKVNKDEAMLFCFPDDIIFIGGGPTDRMGCKSIYIKKRGVCVQSRGSSAGPGLYDRSFFIFFFPQKRLTSLLVVVVVVWFLHTDSHGLG